MGRTVVIGIPRNNFCLECGRDKGRRVYVCETCQSPQFNNERYKNTAINDFFWFHHYKIKSRMWYNEKFAKM